MAASLGAAYVTVKADRSKLKGGLDKAYRTTDSFAGKMQKRISLINFKAVGIAAAAMATGAVYALSKVISSTVSLANAQEAAEKRLEAVIRSTGQAAGFTTKEMIDMAGALQKVTTVGDETIIAGQAILATFKNIAGDAFKRTTAAALDLSEVMQQDLRSSVVMLGKAMNDPIANLGALGRAGIQFEKEQKELIKTLWASGKQMEAQEMILKELESQFGGAAAAAKNTFGGAVKSAKNVLGDLGEQIGFAITKNETFVELVKELETYFISLKPKIKEIADEFVAWTAANREFIASKIVDTIKDIKAGVVGLWELYQKLPAGAVGAAGYGLIGTMIFGPQAGATIAALVLLNAQLKKFYTDADAGAAALLQSGAALDDILEAAGVGTVGLRTFKIATDDTAGGVEDLGKTVKTVMSDTERYVKDGARIITQDMTGAAREISTDWTEAYGLMHSEIRQLDDHVGVFSTAAIKDFDGVSGSWLNDLDDIGVKSKTVWEQIGIDVGILAYDAKTALSDGFFAVIKGDIDSLPGIFESFIDSMLRQLTDFLASKAVAGIVSFFSGGLFGGGGSLIGGIGGIIGGIIDWFQHGTAEVPETGIYGLHKGEMVIPPEQSEMLRNAGFGSEKGYSSSTTGSGSNRSGDGLFGRISSSLANEAAFASGYPGTSKGAQYGGAAASVVGSLIGSVFGPAGGFIASNLLGAVGALVGGFVNDLIGPANDLHDDAVMSIDDVTDQMEKLGIDTVDIVGKSAVELAMEVAGLMDDFGDQFNTMAFAAEQYTKEMYENFRTKASDFGDFTEVSAEQKSRNWESIKEMIGLGSGSSSGGGGAGDMGDGGSSSGSGSVEHFGNWRIPRTARYELMKGEIVIPRDAAESMRNSNARDGGSNQAGPREIKIYFNDPVLKNLIRVEADDLIVKYERRPVGARRTNF